MTSPPSLRSRIRNGTLAMLVIAVVLGTLALPEVNRLGGAIQRTLYRNYVSIEASRHMHAAFWRLQLAERDGTLASVLSSARDEFLHWIDVEEHNITEDGEAELARDIDRRGHGLLAELASAKAGSRHDQEFIALHRRLDALIEINRDAMFRANSRATRMGDQLTYGFAAGLIVLLLLGTILSWTLAWTISQPLNELTESLRSFSLRGPSLRLGKQPLAELESVASEFNKMAERLEQFEKLNVHRLIYEKGKTEAIIESLEDGIVLIDPNGIVTHINQVAAIILGVERADALGSPFDDLDSNHPHYLRVRGALQSVANQPLESQRVEVDLHVRGRDHSYLLKPVPLRQEDGQSFGTIVILQDITYLRDKDRARTNLVATLSHELKNPLTSLGSSAELLEQGRDSLDSEQRQLVETIKQDVARLRSLADNLLDLARGDVVAITMQGTEVDLAQLTRSMAKVFAPQAQQKGVRLAVDIGEESPRVSGDPIKLSWVVSNLVANALRYTPAGGTITISSERTADRIQLKVSDTGPGLPPQLRDRLFERFTRWNADGAEAGSAGLGLAIAKDIVEAHGGRILVDSEVGKGTCFIVSLPALAHHPGA